MKAGLVLLLLVIETFFRPTPFLTRNTDVVLQPYAQSYILPLAIWLFLNKKPDRKRMKTTTTLSPTALSLSTPVPNERSTPESTTTTNPSCYVCEALITTDISNCSDHGCGVGPNTCVSLENGTPILCGQIVSQTVCTNVGCTYNTDLNFCEPVDKEIVCADIIDESECNLVDDSCCVFNSSTNKCEQA